MLTSLVPQQSMRRSLAERCHRYTTQLPGSPAEEYLARRGITPETVARFQIGYVADPAPGDERYQDRLAIPYLTISGVVQIRFRTLADAAQKYLGDAGVENRLFNTISFASLDPKMYITEGEIDALTLSQIGLNSVGLPGSTSWKPVYWRCFRYREVTVVADGDAPSVKMADEVAGSIGKRLGPCRVVVMDDGEDVNSYLQKHGAEALKKRVGAEK